MEQQCDQLLATRGQTLECFAQRGVALGGQQFLLGCLDALIREGLIVQHVPGRARTLRRAQGPGAFPPGYGGQPAGKRGRIAEPTQLFHEV